MYISTRTPKNGTVSIRKLFFVIVLVSASLSLVKGQSPGGVSSTLTAWFKANTSIASNITLNGTNVSQWKSEVSTNAYSVTQATATKQPLLITTANANNNFNFNPSIQFDRALVDANAKSLNNTSSTPDLLGTNGTVFLMVNTYNYAGNGSSRSASTCFAYTSNSLYRYQTKANFRIQTGNNGTGYTADFNPQYPTEYGDAAGRILVSRSTGTDFYSKRNGEKFSINNAEPLYNPAVSTGLCIGSNNNSGGTEYTNSAIAEVITYNTTLTDADINKVESYLAIKYGITLNQSATYTNNYTASTGSIIWNRAANSNYATNITGIGRDDASGLLQKQSKSVNAAALVSIYNGNTAGIFPAMNTDNTTSFTADQSFFLIGDNGASTNLLSCSYNGKMPRMSRVWKVQKTGTVNTVTIAANTADVPTQVKNLLVSTDPTFPAGSTTVYPLLSASGKWYVPVSLSTNDYFTFSGDSILVALTPASPSCTNPLSGNVTATVTGGVTPYTYLWTPSAQTTANLSNVAAGTYSLTVSQGLCQYTQQAIIAPVVLPTTPTVNSLTICSGSTATFTVQNIQSGITYNWYTAATGGTSIATGTSFTSPALTAAATYYAEAVSSTGCISTARGSGTASLYTPLAQPTVTAPTATIGVNSVVFNWLPITGAVGYQVIVNGGTPQVPSSGSTGLSHTVTGLPALTTVSIQVVALGAQPCQNSIAGTATAKTLTDEVFIPNVFTPNGDGRNELFKVYSNVVASMEMMVFNQWGELIFQNSDLSKGWDGTYKGKQQPVGVYVYAISLKLIGGNEIIRKGDVNLVR